MNFNRITNTVFKDSFNISTLVGQQQKDREQTPSAGSNKNQSKSDIEESTPAFTSGKASAPQQRGKENVDGLPDKKVGSSGVDENEKRK